MFSVSCFFPGGSPFGGTNSRKHPEYKIIIKQLETCQPKQKITVPSGKLT